MPIPADAKVFTQQLDPSDIVDFYAAISTGAASDTPPPILISPEGVASFVVALATDAAAAGLKIMGVSDGYPAPSITNNVLVFWLGAPTADPTSPIFADPGTKFGIDVTFTTNNSPPRKKNKTMVVIARNQPA